MAECSANLPVHQRILLSGVVANHQDGPCLIELADSAHRFARALPERRREPRVIRGAVVIDVIGSNLPARQPPQQEIFFVGRAVGPDEPDGCSPVRLVCALQPRRHFAHGIFPRGRLQFPAASHQRLPQALGMADEVKAESSFHAQKFLVDSREVTIVGSQHGIIAHAERSLTAVRAVRADG